MSSILRRKFLASSAAVLGVFSLNQNIAAEPVKEQAKKDNSEKFDFVVIGAGAAGLAAAIEAKQAGASTVLLEKAPRPDGNT
ncbi:FAD-dependent oxidoreductase, partial [Turicimonas muris]